MTNGDRIRKMSNEELAKWLDEKFRFSISCEICMYDIKNKCNYKCIEGIKAYLDMEEV